MKPFDVNIRAVYGMRTIGYDHTGLWYLELAKAYVKAVADNSMNAAARELGRSETITNIGISLDG